MKFKELSIQFSQSAEEEIVHLVHELKLMPIAEVIQNGNGDIPQELGKYFESLVQLLNDIFSTEVPPQEEPEVTLRKSSRDINLSRLLRERGIFRLFRLINTRDAQGMLWFMKVVNPDTGQPFRVQEEFIGWFCENAKVTRAMVFMRLAAISRLLTLGFDLGEAFKAILSKPFVIQKALKDVAVWDKGNLVSIDPDIAIRMADKVFPEGAEEVRLIAEASREDADAKEELRQLMIPVMAKLIDELAEHERAGDATKFVEHDILMRPEITYTWERDSNVLVVSMEKRTMDLETGMEYFLGTVSVPFVPDVVELPEEIIQDLLRRLPIKNKGLDTF